MMRSSLALPILAVFTLAGCAKTPVGPGESTASVASPPTASSARAVTHTEIDWSAHPGALVRLGLESTVGALLEEIPERQRLAIATELLAKPSSFWIDRAKRQIRMTSLRLSFRNAFYPKGTKWQLPLPPEAQWRIELLESPRRTFVDGHDAVTVRYRFSGVLLSDESSPGMSEPALATIGGTWDEPFVFPVDPELLFQRTGYACVDEGQFPPNSVDAEEMDLFYDHACRVEPKLTNTGCHQTAMPAESCLTALRRKVGSVTTAMRFERIAWDHALAESVRVGDVTNPSGPDLEPDHEEFRINRFTYRYIPADSCTLTEQCVGGPGWRKLLMFPTADLNVGARALDIGIVDYFHTQRESLLAQHGLFEYSACHEHYHFSHYGEITLGDGSDAVARKNGFCMQPTARLWNNELSPLRHPYVDCVNQGVASGWIDEYKMGLECQWVDVTQARTGEPLSLAFETNPDGLLCEGTIVRDPQGDELFEPTSFKTSGGKLVSRQQCRRYDAWDANNRDAYHVVVPKIGESYVTGPCREGVFGPLRNCGFANGKTLRDCAPGKKTTVRCAIDAGKSPQVVRLCEGSRVLGSGIPCTANDALGSAVVETSADIAFTCPSARDAAETGGTYAVMTGPLVPGGGNAEVTCTLRP